MIFNKVRKKSRMFRKLACRCGYHHHSSCMRGEMQSCIASDVGVASEVQGILHTAEWMSEAEEELDQ